MRGILRYYVEHTTRGGRKMMFYSNICFDAAAHSAAAYIHVHLPKERPPKWWQFWRSPWNPAVAEEWQRIQDEKKKGASLPPTP